MNLGTLTNILQQPELLTVNQIAELKTVIDQYPYFQPAHALYLKALKIKDSYKYNSALKIAAAYTADRSVLFDFITSETFNQNEISLQIKRNSEYIKSIEVKEIDDISVNKSVTIDNNLKKYIEETEGVLDPNLFKAKSTETILQTEDEESLDDKKELAPEAILSIGKPLEFDTSEKHSFMEWLKLTNATPIDRNKDLQSEKRNAPLAKKLETINKFISNNPKIKPAPNAPKPKLVDTEKTGEDELMTETLARIYLEQKNYEKAIQSYKILSLKYPEKSSFFADQIKSSKELQKEKK